MTSSRKSEFRVCPKIKEEQMGVGGGGETYQWCVLLALLLIKNFELLPQNRRQKLENILTLALYRSCNLSAGQGRNRKTDSGGKEVECTLGW